MTTFELILLMATAGVGGIVAGYILRWLISLGKKGSIELKVQETLLEAKDRVRKKKQRNSQKKQSIVLMKKNPN